MAEETCKDPFPDLRELENKVGRKTPESLLAWMRDAAGREDDRTPGVAEGRRRGSGMSDKINYLKQEMRLLRSADVKILSQLLAVHEGIEAMRWLMEDRGTIASRGSSLTGSLSSLVTVEEFEPWMSHFRESPSPSWPQDLTEITGEKSEDQRPPHTKDSDPDHKTDSDTLSLEFTEAKPHRPYADCEVSFPTHEMLAQTSTDRASLGQSQSLKTNANTIRKALHRSSRRRELSVDSFIVTKQSDVAQTESQTQKKGRATWNKTVEEDERANNTKVLMGYDAQWYWVESEDDVTFL